jgi:hypothetical protein
MGPPVHLLAALTLWTAPAEELVRWEAPPECPSQVELTDAIAANLGRPLAARDVAALTAVARARRRPDGRWALSLTLVPRAGAPVERAAIADECPLLAETAALIVAVALDPTLAGLPPLVTATSRGADEAPLAVEVPPRLASARAPAQPPASPDEPARAGAPPRGEPPPRTRAGALRMSLAVAAALDVGALPGPAPGLLARAGLLARRVRAELGVVHWFERPARLPGTAIGGDLRLTAAQLLACPRLALRRVELPVCAGVEVGAMAGEGVGLPVAATDRIPWLAALAEARALWVPIPRLAVGVQLGLAVPLLAARFRIDGLDGDLHRAAPVAFRGALALELRIL